jgi:type III pantothenate kinase
MMAVLEIDAGNSRIKWRVLGLEEAQHQVQSVNVAVAAAKEAGTLPGPFRDKLAALVDGGIQNIRVANVRGKAFASELADACEQFFGAKPYFARIENHQNGISSSYSEPTSMGIDRWLAMQAVHALNKSAACIVDCGSAMTIDLLSAEGRHLGGFIVPGFLLMQSALHKGTADLPLPAEQSFALVPGMNTQEAIQNGSLNVLLALLERVRQHWAKDSEWYFCGGDASLLSTFIEWQHHLNADLVLDGLQHVCGAEVIS